MKLAAVPLCFWLLSLADELPSLVLGIIIAVVDMAAFGEFWTRVPAIPSVVSPQWLLLGVAGLTSLLAALLMLTQKSLKRLLVLSTIEDAGFLLLGIASATRMGMEGALIAAATHALAKALLFTCLSAPENAGELDLKRRARGAIPGKRIRTSVFGMLAMLGVPPLLGFAGRWRLYESALLVHPAIAAVFILSSIFALIAYVLALTGKWWGPNPTRADPACKTCPRREVAPVQAVIVALVCLLLAAGAWPGLLQLLEGGR